ncbi:MAG TPA: hypothetical protein VJB57_10705 [Dehalococcoidia bacterium]|nr:hypothetical protein [Dehalococcoidia bacterium]
MNREWHLANRMPKNASTDQRIAWHLAHQQNCTCRPTPEKLQAEITRRSGRKA